ncbi:Phage tail fiber protein [Rhodopirellula islandica]|uniref:Phage tail fiber protein n=1 Tax=Rhodopirellula islandica TaxID=595434 RepID=A0A0J1BBK4_RHOIS|nr:hypothetical protein [Rhodopirellula islandica]KLU03891.1 Phage tail fiber protein [Rhodopirellula islandica]
MTGKTIHELLELPEHVTSPHAYQVFGLNPGESNAATIHEAIAQRINQLKTAKPATAPETWSRAAQVLQTAQRTLTDPKKKAKLDARFGIVSMDASTSAPAANTTPNSAPAAPVVDPLAALLPTSPSPSAATPQPTAPTSAPAPAPATEPVIAEVVEASVVGGPVSSAPAVDQVRVTPGPAPATDLGNLSTTTASSPNPSPAPLVVQSRSPSAARARRRQSSGGWLMGGFLLLGFVIVGFLAAFFFWGPGEVQVVRSNDGITIRTKNDNANRPGQSQSTVVDRAEPARQGKPSSDGIMKRPGAGQAASGDSLGNFLSNPDSMPDASIPDAGPTPGMGMQADATDNMQPSGPQPGVGGMSPATSGMQPEGMQPTPETSPPDPSPPMGMTPETPPEATPESIQAGETAITAAENAIRQSDWSTMKTLAETAEKAAANEEQVTRAETVYQITDLATYYRGGVSRAMANLNAGNEFNVTDAISLLVVEASADQLIARRGARNYTYPLNEVPFVVSQALAAFQLPMESETGQAAQAVYESIASKSTPEVRADAVSILRSLQNVEGADVQRIAEWIETRYTPNTSQ